MRKIISLFQRNYEGDRLIRDEIVPGAEWVMDGEGIPTEKIDGTSCLWRDGKLWKRYDAKQAPTAAAQPGQETPKIKAPKAPPPLWVPAQDPDPITGHWPGWLPVCDAPEDKWHRAARFAPAGEAPMEGTYELVGPKVQGNPHGLAEHLLYRHGASAFTSVSDAPRDFKGLRDYFAVVSVEGIVWHHSDGRLVKIKTRDFGLRWPR